VKKFLGIQLSPTIVQYEGLQAVMDRIQDVGADAVCLGFGIARPAEPGQGRREPPLDIDGWERLLDRPLWGKRELWLHGYRTHDYDVSLFADTPYHPGGELAPEARDREVPMAIVAEAHARGMRAHVQASPTVVPGVRPEDDIVYPDGSHPDPNRRVARQGCLNSPAVRAYGLALVRDTIRHSANADGLCLDWVEYTTYTLEDHFACLCPHCAAAAGAAGYDWERIRRDVTAMWDRLHNLTSRDLERAARIAARPWEAAELLQAYPGWLDFLRFKADTVRGWYADVRRAMNEEGASTMELGANGWAPPFNRSSGMDYRGLADIVQTVRPKLFTFHWSALPRWYGETLLRWNPALSERQLLDALVACLDLPDAVSPRSFASYHIPAPEDDHPATPESWRAKLDEVVDQVGAGSGGRCRCYAYAHSYRSEAQWKRMVAVVRDSRVDGMWVQRYEYMNDDKLAALKGMWR